MFADTNSGNIDKVAIFGKISVPDLNLNERDLLCSFQTYQNSLCKQTEFKTVAWDQHVSALIDVKLEF